MRLQEFYDFLVKAGAKQDPRGQKAVEAILEKTRQKYQKMEAKAKNGFDRDKLTNPYADTRILYGNPQAVIKNILVGVDIDVAELLLADRLRTKGEKIDLVMSHHPAGKAYANFYEVMGMQADILQQFGIPINVAEQMLEKRIKEVEKKVMPANHMRASDAARLLDIPFMCAHTVADNHVASYLQKKLDQAKVQTVDEVMKVINGIPEYKIAAENNNPPRILIGRESNRAGKVFVDMTGGTEGSTDIFEKMAQAGIGTLVCMHLSEKHAENAEKAHLNAVIAGHISSDNLGLNLMLDSVTKQFGDLKIIPCSGFVRVKHN
ncbi:MAG: NGG1p interacting factor NIF3 [bacterium]|nr:NGG1p interacting factor NIF3 [bacterium]MDD5354068.1 NGG1p interacting factor NIF3 [bacterium]MDD5756945.1 NGG1p interacting factor NIF3 [bacterium]